MDEDLKRYWELFVPVAIRIIERKHQMRNDELKELFGISSVHVKYILILNTRKCTLGELSECLFLNKANTTRIIASLRDMGYVTDDRASANSRKYNVFLTLKGIEVLKYLKKRMDSDIEHSFMGISDDEIRSCLSVIERICTNIDKDDQYVQILKKLNDTYDTVSDMK